MKVITQQLSVCHCASEKEIYRAATAQAITAGSHHAETARATLDRSGNLT